MNFPTPANFIWNNFKGIRTRNGVNTGGQMSAVVCQNIDFVPNTVNADVQIRSTLGNFLIAQYPDYKLIKGFESLQKIEENSKGTKFCLVYAENETQGVLLKFDFATSVFEIVVEGLSVTGQANAITMIDSAYDVFVFTNGIEYYSVNFAVDDVVTKINPVYDGKAVTGLTICEQAGALVIGSPNGVVISSRKGDIYDWDYAQTADDKNKAWYQLFGKGITAIVPYTGGLMVFTEDDNTLLKGNPSDIASFERSDSSLGGCMSFESWCKHDKYLFFYDNVQKNVYYYTQTDIGQSVVGNPIAQEVQKFFDDVTRLQIVSYIGDNRNEIWVLANDFKLVYDYYIGEWTERVCQALTSYFVYNNAVYSTTNDGKLLREKYGENGIFDNVFYPSVYKMQTINLGSYSNMKEMEMQPLFTVTQNFNNKFWLDCEIDGKKIKSKLVSMYSKSGVWGDDSDPTNIPSDEMWDVAEFAYENDAVTQQVKGKFISNWYYIQFTIQTVEAGQDFNIVAFELKGITEETDTIGRK